MQTNNEDQNSIKVVSAHPVNATESLKDIMNSQSQQNLDSNLDNDFQSNNDLSSSFKSTLFRPKKKTLLNKGKKKPKEMIPAVVTSDEWKQYKSSKEQEKVQKEEEKERRKQIRLEKVKIKQEKNEEKKKKEALIKPKRIRKVSKKCDCLKWKKKFIMFEMSKIQCFNYLQLLRYFSTF